MIFSTAFFMEGCMRPRSPRSEEFAQRWRSSIASRGLTIGRELGRRAAAGDAKGRRSALAWMQIFRRWGEGIVPKRADLADALAALGSMQPDEDAGAMLLGITVR